MTYSIIVFAETDEQVSELYEKLNKPVHFNESSANFDKVTMVEDIPLYYNDDLYVASEEVVPQLLEILQHYYPNKKFNNTLDWCCGAGFIGLSLFAKELTENLVLMDKYLPALKACTKTISGLSTDKISVSDELPEQKFDLIVGNPPWFLINNMSSLYNSLARKTIDLDGEIHKEFFSKVKNMLADDGIIILVEGGSSSSPLYFKDMIEDNGLKITKVLGIKTHPAYYMIIEAV